MKLFQLAKHYTSGMIFQRNQAIKIEGVAFAPCKITASLGEDSNTQYVSPGSFSITLPPRPAARELTLAVQADIQKVELSDIYIGEVWIAGGQSNMEWNFNITDGYRDGVCENSDIRLYTVGRNMLPSPDHFDKGYEWAYLGDHGWKGCDAESAAHFSAVGYHFAQLLHDALQVPVGVISCNVGGSSIATWIPQDKLLANPEIAHVWHNYIAGEGAVPEDQARAALITHLENIKRDNGTEPSASGTARQIPTVWYDTPGPYRYQRPELLYRSMLERVSTFPMRGMLWYQGETDCSPDGSRTYAKLLDALWGNMKEQQKNDAFAFHLVQLAPWDEPGAIFWADVCNQQKIFAQTNPGVGVVTIGDCGGGTDIHPPRKQPVGERLARAALNYNYAMPQEYTGPLATGAMLEAGEVRVEFSHAEKLHVVGDIGRFELIYENGDKKAAPAAVVRNGAVYLSLPTGFDTSPVFVQYEYVPHPQIGLYNAAGIPASCFKVAVL